MRAYRLFNTSEGHSAFEKGNVADLHKINASYFFFQEDALDRRALDWHPAPRAQYVVTLRGTLEFTVTDGTTFVIEPGDVLIAADVTGSGHKWRMLSDDSWIRTYIVLEDPTQDGFTPDTVL